MKVSGWRRLRTGVILTSTLILALVAMSGFAAKAGVATSRYATQPFDGTSPATGVNAPPAGSQPFSTGHWDANHYRIPFHVASCPQPPQSVQARLALVNSPTALKLFGLPTLAQVGDLAKWQQIVTHDQTRGCDYTIPYLYGKPSQNTNGSSPNTLWGGFGAQECSGCYNFNGTQGNYTVEQVSTCFAECKDSIWAGVGGANGNQLVQAGVAQSNISGSTNYQAFYETEPGGSEHDWHSVGALDDMWSAAYANGDVYDSDFTLNLYYNTNVGKSSSYDSSEFIVERSGMANCGNPVCWPLGDYWQYAITGVKYQLSTQNWYPDDDSHENFWVWNLYNQTATPHHFLESNSNYADSGGASTWTEVFNTGS